MVEDVLIDKLNEIREEALKLGYDLVPIKYIEMFEKIAKEIKHHE